MQGVADEMPNNGHENTPLGAGNGGPLVTKMNYDTLQIVFENLALQDVLAMRRVAKFMVAVSKARTIWEQLVKDHMRSIPGAFYLQKPLREHSVDEMEQQLAKWYRRKTIWREEQPESDIRRQCSSLELHPNIVPELVQLLPGGRWAIGVTTREAVIYTDLHSSGSRNWLPLISEYPEWATTTPGEGHEFPEPLIAIDYLNTDTLAFNVALIRDRPSNAGRPVVEVWRVEETSEEALVAVRLASFPEQPGIDISLDCFSLHGSYVAYKAVREHDDQLDFMHIIVDWQAVGVREIPHFPRRILNDFDSESIYLLPNQQLLSFGECFRTLISWGDLKEELDLPSEELPPIPDSMRLELEDEEFDDIYVSRPYFFPDSTRFVVKTTDKILGIAIPRNSASLSIIKIPLGLREKGIFCLGAHCTYETVAAVYGETPLFLRVNWPQDILGDHSERQVGVSDTRFEARGPEIPNTSQLLSLSFDEASYDTLLVQEDGGEENAFRYHFGQ